LDCLCQVSVPRPFPKACEQQRLALPLGVYESQDGGGLVTQGQNLSLKDHSVTVLVVGTGFSGGLDFPHSLVDRS
jgi:hypothetical protein